MAEIENRAEINGEGSVSQMSNICVASDTTGISTEAHRDPHGISPLPSTLPSSISKGRGVNDGGPLNHFLRENWNFRQEAGGYDRDTVAVVDAKRLRSSFLLISLRGLSERGGLPPQPGDEDKKDVVKRYAIATAAINTRVTSKEIEKKKRISVKKMHPTLFARFYSAKLKGNFAELYEIVVSFLTARLRLACSTLNLKDT